MYSEIEYLKSFATRKHLINTFSFYINDNLTHFVERLIPTIKDKVSSEHFKSINI